MFVPADASAQAAPIEMAIPAQGAAPTDVFAQGADNNQFVADFM